MYLDEVGVIKQLPPNPRANAIAMACGHAEAVQFFGDIFVGRIASQVIYICVCDQSMYMIVHIYIYILHVVTLFIFKCSPCS